MWAMGRESQLHYWGVPPCECSCDAGSREGSKGRVMMESDSKDEEEYQDSKENLPSTGSGEAHSALGHVPLNPLNLGSGHLNVAVCRGVHSPLKGLNCVRRI